MVNDHHYKKVPIDKGFDEGYILFIVDISIVLGSGAYLLQRINDNEPAVDGLINNSQTGRQTVLQLITVKCSHLLASSVILKNQSCMK